MVIGIRDFKNAGIGIGIKTCPESCITARSYPRLLATCEATHTIHKMLPQILPQNVALYLKIYALSLLARFKKNVRKVWQIGQKSKSKIHFPLHFFSKNGHKYHLCTMVIDWAVAINVALHWGQHFFWNWPIATCISVLPIVFFLNRMFMLRSRNVLDRMVKIQPSLTVFLSWEVGLADLPNKSTTRLWSTLCQPDLGTNMNKCILFEHLCLCMLTVAWGHGWSAPKCASLQPIWLPIILLLIREHSCWTLTLNVTPLHSGVYWWVVTRYHILFVRLDKSSH